MKLYAIRIFVGDLDGARSFYSGKLALPELWETETAIGYDVGATLIVEGEAGDEPHLVGRFTGLSLWVADIDAAYAGMVSEGVTFVGPPERQDWGGVLAHFRDPDGNVLTLVSEA